MAYTQDQHRLIAHAIAVVGGNVAKAAKYIADNYVQIGEVSESTIRRLLVKPGFAELIAESVAARREVEAEAIRDAERQRMKRDMEGSFGERIASMERKAWELFERINEEMEQSGADKRELIIYWQNLMSFVTKLKSHAAPAIAELWQAEALIRSYQKVLMKKCGAALTEQIQRDVGKEYQLTLTAEQAKAAENAQEAEVAGATAGA